MKYQFEESVKFTQRIYKQAHTSNALSKISNDFSRRLVVTVYGTLKFFFLEGTYYFFFFLYNI